MHHAVQIVGKPEAVDLTGRHFAELIRTYKKKRQVIGNICIADDGLLLFYYYNMLGTINCCNKDIFLKTS